MRIAILAFDGCNEIDIFVPLGLLNQLDARGWKAELACPTSHVTTRSGVTVQAQRTLEFANEADGVIFGGGLYSRAIAENSALLDRFQLDPVRQMVGGLGAGTLLLARLGLLGDMPAASDAATRPWLLEAGVRGIDTAFHSRGPIATAAGPLAAPYLAAWMMLQGAGHAAATRALSQAAPVGEKDSYVERLLAVVAGKETGGPQRA